jgi:hypothetical protein
MVWEYLSGNTFLSWKEKTQANKPDTARLLVLSVQV